MVNELQTSATLRTNRILLHRILGDGFHRDRET